MHAVIVEYLGFRLVASKILLHTVHMCSGAPRFKFGLNASLIDGILNVLPYDLASHKGYEKPKKWSKYSSNHKIFCDL